MSRPLVLALALGLAAPAAAAVAQARPGKAGVRQPGAQQPLLRPSPKLPVHIQADQLVAHAGGHSATFSGHVHVAQAGYTLTCDRLTVFYGAGQKVERLVADGHVKVVQGNRVVTSERAELDNKKRLLTLTGEPVVTQGENVLKGELITLNLATNQVKVAQVQAKVKIGDLTGKDGGSK